ncbi:glycosyl hydrolase [Paenibacillus glycanilyticus]|uniref:Glycosyl hydrolase n=1 Tax=Paenibacillus glycanilyticus TaxID=126569 RepID=A0ABQ6NMY2_9BACL|nr:beta-L-arabinofuranosidase domain-containing protein [Paenibacillus glycanilyticus]GMK46438.1 glycosyl hydrolase [Paenibacillus glycanilyticus]
MFVNFKLDEVKLTDQTFACRRALVKSYISEFNVDRLMHNFKINAGIPSNAEPLGGWEDGECGLRGHFVGHFLSACAKFAFADQDGLLKSKASAIVDIMELCAKPSGYLSAFEEEKLDILEFEENRKVWAPYYTLHKIMQGLVDCYSYLGNSKSLQLAVNLALYIYRRFEKLSYWKIDGILRCTKLNPVNEFGGIGDTIYTLYDLTGDDRLFQLANKFDRMYFVDTLEAGHDILEDLHANTHLPMVIAAMHRFSISGETKYKEMAINFYHFLQGRTFANGNSSSKATAYIQGSVSEKSEHWGGFGKLGDALTGGESESCCAHNTEKILERLLEWSGAVEYLEHLETLKYNAVLNSASAKTGLSQYHQPLGHCAIKKFSEPYNSFWCCTASGIEAMSEIQKNIWFKSEGTILLNAFISSTVIWREQKAVISQTSEFPNNPTSRLVIEVTEPTSFKLLLKRQAIKGIKINGTPIDVMEHNGYIIVEHTYNNRDIVDIDIHADLKRVPLQGSEDISAVMYGNILLAQVGHQRIQEDITDSNLLEKFIQLPTVDLAFSVEGHREMKFIPLYRVEEEEYTVYSDWTGQAIQHGRCSL